MRGKRSQREARRGIGRQREVERSRVRPRDLKRDKERNREQGGQSKSDTAAHSMKCICVMCDLRIAPPAIPFRCSACSIMATLENIGSVEVIATTVKCRPGCCCYY